MQGYCGGCDWCCWMLVFICLEFGVLFQGMYVRLKNHISVFMGFKFDSNIIIIILMGAFQSEWESLLINSTHHRAESFQVGCQCEPLDYSAFCVHSYCSGVLQVIKSTPELLHDMRTFYLSGSKYKYQWLVYIQISQTLHVAFAPHGVSATWLFCILYTFLL